jgi:hypothetical protein
MLLATLAVPADGLKFLLLVLVGGRLLALGRWSSRLGPTGSGDAPGNTPTPDTAELPPSEESNPKVWPPSAEEVAASLPFDPALGDLRIRKFYFKKADAIPGPDDPEVFADELNIELYDPDSGHAWWQSYFVATPQGLAKLSCCERSPGDTCTHPRFWFFLATIWRKSGLPLSVGSGRKMSSSKARSRPMRNLFNALTVRQRYLVSKLQSPLPVPSPPLRSCRAQPFPLALA